MSDPLSVTASIVSIVAVGCHVIRLLSEDLKHIQDASETVKSLRNEVESVKMILQALEATNEEDWSRLSLGTAVQVEVAVKDCHATCNSIQKDLHDWTRRAIDGKLDWLDRTKLGFFKQERLKKMSEQLQKDKIAMLLVCNVTIVSGTFRHNHALVQIQESLSLQDTKTLAAIESIDEQLVALRRRLHKASIDLVHHPKQVQRKRKGKGKGREKDIEEEKEGEDKSNTNSQELNEEISRETSDELKSLEAVRKDLVETLLKMQKMKSATDTMVPTSNVPFHRDRQFVPRQILLDQLHERCPQPSTTVLVGLGGVGKSQLVIEYSYQLREVHPDIWVFWVYANNATRLEQSFRQIADQLELPGRTTPDSNTIQLVHDWLCNRKSGKWLLILDNFDDEAISTLTKSQGQCIHACGCADNAPSFLHCLARSQNGSMLITTCSQAVATAWGDEGNVLSVEPMSIEQAVELLKRKLNRPEEEDTLIELVTTLEFMPLAIAQAAYYLSQRGPRFTARRYLENFREGDLSRLKLFDQDGGSLRRDWDAKMSIFGAWHLSFEHVRQSRRSAADLLSLMSFFDRQSIPESLLRQQYTSLGVVESSRTASARDDLNHDSHTDDHVSQSATEEDGFEKDILVLKNYLLIEDHVDAESFRMHRLMQLAMRSWLENQGQLEQWKEKYVHTLFANFPGDVRYEDLTHCQVLFPHTKAAISQRPRREMFFQEWSEVLLRAVNYALIKGYINDAEEMALKVFHERERVHGKDDRKTLTSMMYVSMAYRAQRQWKKAEDIQLKLLQTPPNVPGEHDDLVLLDVKNYLAQIYYDQGKWSDAEKLQKEIMAQTAEFGDEDPRALRSTSWLATFYIGREMWSEALPLQERTLEVYRRDLGEENDATLECMSSLATTYVLQKRYSDAERHQKMVLDTRTRLNGAKHAWTIRMQMDLASTYQCQERWLDSESLLASATESIQDVYGIQNRLYAHTICLLGCARTQLGYLKEGQDLLQQALTIQKEVLGDTHLDTLISTYSLSHNLHVQGEFVPAVDLMNVYYNGVKDLLGEDHARTQNGLEWLTHWQKGLNKRQRVRSGLGYLRTTKKRSPVARKKRIPIRRAISGYLHGFNRRSVGNTEGQSIELSDLSHTRTT